MSHSLPWTTHPQQASVTVVCSFPKMDLFGLHMPLHMHIRRSADGLHNIHNRNYCASYTLKTPQTRSLTTRTESIQLKDRQGPHKSLRAHYDYHDLALLGSAKSRIPSPRPGQTCQGIPFTKLRGGLISPFRAFGLHSLGNVCPFHSAAPTLAVALSMI